MIDKLAQAGKGRGVHIHPLLLIYHYVKKVAVYTPVERADTLPLFHLYPYVLCGFSC
jgi:hypothetical protein